MALGTKEDGHFAEGVGKEEELIIFKGLYSPNFVCAKFASLDKNFVCAKFASLDKKVWTPLFDLVNVSLTRSSIII